MGFILRGGVGYYGFAERAFYFAIDGKKWYCCPKEIY
jgi:hypothetical protein